VQIDVPLPAAAGYRYIDISRQRTGAGTAHSSDSILRGTIGAEGLAVTASASVQRPDRGIPWAAGSRGSSGRGAALFAGLSRGA
jgi:hypothetical protein